MSEQIDLETDGHLEEFVASVQQLVGQDPFLKQYSFVLMANDNELYKAATKGMRVKPVGPNNGTTKMLEQMCPTNCGCKLKTDGNFVWCSGVMCDYIGKKESF